MVTFIYLAFMILFNRSWFRRFSSAASFIYYLRASEVSEKSRSLTCTHDQSGFESRESERKDRVTSGIYYFVTSVLLFVFFPLDVTTRFALSAFDPLTQRLTDSRKNTEDQHRQI